MKKLLCLLAVILLLSCDSKSPEDIIVNPGFSSYINAFTSGVISSSSTIKIVLIEPHPDAVEGGLVAQELFDFEPSIEGHAYWLDQSTIEFRPAEQLPSGQSYIGEFELGDLMDVPSEFETLEFGFTVISQHIFVEYNGLQSIDDNDYSKQELLGSLRTSDHADISAVEAALQASQDGRELEVEWVHTDGSKTHDFIVKGVERADDEKFVILKWDGKAMGSESKSELEVRIPPLGEFTLLKVSTQRLPSLHFSIQFSDPLDANQELAGLIHLQSGKGLRLVVAKNEIKAYPSGSVSAEEEIVIEQSIRNVLGNTLQASYTRKVQFNLERPGLELLGDGVIMPSSGGISFPFKAVNLKAVSLRIIQIYAENVPQFLQVNQLNGSNELTRVGRMVVEKDVDLISDDPIDYGVWNNFSIDLGSLIDPEPGAIYRVILGFDQYQSLYPCPETAEQVRPTQRRQLNFDDGNGYYNDRYFYYYDYDYYDYDYSEREDPCSPSFYRYNNTTVGANLMASDLGIIAKQSSGGQYDVVVTDLRTSEPLSGVEVIARNYQNMSMGAATTDRSGMARISVDGKPYLIEARDREQRGYLRVDNGSALSMSLFEVAGEKIEKGIKGFLYGERGVWRPGDTIFLSFMLEDKQGALPKNHPVVVEFFDPLGKLYDRQVQTKSTDGLFAFKLKTKSEDVTGVWRAVAKVGNSSFSKSLKIETVKPNRLRIDLGLEDIVTSTTAERVNLTAAWLYGASGAGLKARIEMEVDNMKTQFKGYDGYQFDDRTKSYYFGQPIIGEGVTDSKGVASIGLDWRKPESAPGMLKIKYSTKVFEQGGDFSQDFASAKYSPYQSYVGLKMDGGNNWMTAVNTESTHAVAIAAVDENGNPVNRSVDIELYKMDWNWWWEGDGSNELTRYIRRSSAELLSTTAIEVSKGKAKHNLSFPKKGWGRYLLRVIDSESGHSASQVFYGEYPGWYNNSSGGNDAASMLALEPEQNAYSVGQEIKVSVPNGGVGNIFVSVEKGDRVIDQFWMEADGSSSSIAFDATAEMAPNVYVNAMLIQPHGQSENSLPIRMYGVVPVNISDPNTELTPVIQAPKTLRPETEFTVKISEKNNNPMAYSLAVVDEGLLGLTRFGTPDPWNHFYRKEALTTRTWDMYRYVMNAQTGKMASLLAVGGDEGLVFKKDQKANRFKPVVKYLGPFFLKKGSNTHKIKLPNYIGAVRVMVVAGHEGAYGKAEHEIQVKQPLMVMSTLPRVLGPSERIRVPVNIIAMDDKLGKTSVRITTNELLSPVNESTQTLNFSKAGDETVFFQFDVARKLGVAKFKVEVRAGNESAFEEVEILVRAPNPEITKTQNLTLEPGESRALSYEAFGITGTNEATLSVARIPELDIEKHLKYLIRYPHGCIEQSTSAAFPQLFVDALMEVSAQQKEAIRENVVAALNRLRSFQMSDGGFSYWPGTARTPSEWGSNYAGHFMLEAESKGYDLPPGLRAQWVKFQKQMAASWTRSSYNEYGRYGGDIMQSYRLYTLALAGNADVGAMNRLRADKELSTAGAWRLAAAYALIGRKDVANDLIKGEAVIPEYREMGWSYGSRLRDQAMMLETLGILKDYDRGTDLLMDVAETLNRGWHSTQTRAYSILAISKFVGGSASSTMSFEATLNGRLSNVNTNKAYHTFSIDKAAVKSGDITVRNTSDQLLFVSLIQSGIPVEMNDGRVRDDLQMQISYRDLQNNVLNVSKLEAGQDFKALVSIAHPGVRSSYEEVALSQIFPSGWQIVNTRVAEDSDNTGERYDYQDIRDDRVYTYFDLGKRNSVTFEVLLNATFVGKFYQPAVFCAPMYDESVKALEPGSWIEVTAP